MTQIFTLDTLKYMDLNGFGEEVKVILETYTTVKLEGVTYFKKEL